MSESEKGSREAVACIFIMHTLLITFTAYATVDRVRAGERVRDREREEERAQ